MHLCRAGDLGAPREKSILWLKHNCNSTATLSFFILLIATLWTWISHTVASESVAGVLAV